MGDFASTPAEPEPFLFEGPEIPERWIDANGHVNLANYSAIFLFAARNLSTALGLTREFKSSTNTATYAAKMNISYLRELLAGDTITIEARVVGFDTRRVHGWFGLFRGGELTATCEILSLNIDAATRSVTDMAPETLERVKQLHDDHLALPALAGVGEGIAL